MKTIFSIIFLIVFVLKINAQSIKLSSSKIFKNKEVQKSVELDKSINLFDSFDFLITPQLGGLFNESFKYVEGITNLKNYFDDFDLGLKLGIKYELINRLTFTHVYNIGLLKFNFNESENIQSAIVKATLCYNF
ncbi:hypothetical protein ACGK9U_06945 [Mariniflexile sp. HNIBRBA6329]|uniref:hypothetical protein n=1 Tax=Mariniflexile sp. HNIBRBA6329 TaxID=3373088 RepID=UPI003745B1DB